MERSIEVDTGESVAFSYELAGLGSRFLAVMIDFIIQFLTLLVFVIALGLIALLPVPAALSSQAHFIKTSRALIVAVWSVGVFLLFFGYFVIFEWYAQGRTPGKRLIGIRVVRDGGFPLDFTSSVIRNLVRIIEAAFGFYTISA
ncbi:MAG TPA: RDD family protein, partial [Candidatus Baltobacteraceae bacterium]